MVDQKDADKRAAEEEAKLVATAKKPKDDSAKEAQPEVIDSHKPEQEDVPEVGLTEAQVIPAYKTTETEVMNPIVYQQIKMLANDLIKANALPKGIENSEQVFVLMWTGKEMGMTPFDAVNSLYMVNGAVRIYGKALASQMRKHGYQVEYLDETKDSVTARVFRNTKDGMNEEYKETYTFAEAEQSGHTKDKYGLKFGWKEGSNRRLKLRYGALSLILRTYIPEVLGSTAGIVEVDEDVNTNSVADDLEAKKEKLKAELKAKAEEAKEATNENN